MLTDYSKPPADVAAHTARLLSENDLLRSHQAEVARVLQACQARKHCLVCNAAVDGAPRLRHRAVQYVRCRNCGHIQSHMRPPDGYPRQSRTFAEIYRPLSAAEYRQRTVRIYEPKLAWILRSSEAVGLPDIKEHSWLEIGSGAGSFLDALRRAGVGKVVGLEAEPRLVSQANEALGAPMVRHFTGSIAEAVLQHEADIYVAWFVLEHCAELNAVMEALRQRPSGTVFAFSVPTFGLAALMEAAFERHFARNLDSVVHLQLFSDSSIAYAMNRAEFDIKAEWIFGQDADDLFRALMVPLQDRYPAEAISAERERLLSALAGIQSAIDHARLADARHVLAVRR